MIKRRRPANVPDRLASLNQGLELASERLDPQALGSAQLIADKVTERLGLGETHTLVALLGATGVGKSSITNAILGADVATTGVRRPTTSSTLANIWGPDDASSLLGWLEVLNRNYVPGPSPALDGLILLDVPDHDSIEQANRLEMERIAEHADLLVWVTDHEKYADAAMHAYLRQLGGHGKVTTMVLNKIDQLSETDIKSTKADLARLLEQDGLENPQVIGVSTYSGLGVDKLVGVLADTVNRRRAMLDRLEADISSAAADLLNALGQSGEASHKVPRKTSENLASELVGAAGLDLVTEAVSAGHLRDAAAKTGWPFTRWLRSLRPHPLRRLHLQEGSGGRASIPTPSGVQKTRTAGAVRDAVGSVTKDLPHPWPDLVREAAMPQQSKLEDRLNHDVATSVRNHSASTPNWWQVVNVAQIGLAIAAIVGAVWLTLIAFGAYLQIPALPLPEYRRIPIPTGLLVGGLAVGLLLALIARRLASIGAKRRARAVRKHAVAAVRVTADELIVAPMQSELDRRGELQELFVNAGGRIDR